MAFIKHHHQPNDLRPYVRFSNDHSIDHRLRPKGTCLLYMVFFFFCIISNLVTAKRRNKRKISKSNPESSHEAEGNMPESFPHLYPHSYCIVTCTTKKTELQSFHYYDLWALKAFQFVRCWLSAKIIAVNIDDYDLLCCLNKKSLNTVCMIALEIIKLQLSHYQTTLFGERSCFVLYLGVFFTSEGNMDQMHGCVSNSYMSSRMPDGGNVQYWYSTDPGLTGGTLVSRLVWERLEETFRERMDGCRDGCRDA